MGGCVSSKSGGQKTRYTTLPPSYKNQTAKLMDAQDKNVSKRRAAPYTRGQSTLFGFKRRVMSAPPGPPLDNMDSEALESTPQASQSNARANRFGFKSPVGVPSNKVSDSNANLVGKTPALKDKPRTKGGGKILKPVTPAHKPAALPSNHLDQTSRFTLQTSLLPTPQFPIRLASAEQDGRSKTAKTLANNSARIQHGSDSNSSSGSLAADSGLGSQRSADLEIAVLDRSPGSAARRKRRELEVVLQGKSFDVRDLKTKDADDLNVITEISVISLTNHKPALRVAPQPKIRPVNTGQVADRKLVYQQRGIPQRPNTRATANRESREKAAVDVESQEKGELMECFNDWGPGEAMAEEFSVNDDGTKTSNIQPRPIHLAIEEARFAAIAAADSSLIEDERSPVDSLMSNSTPSSDSSELEGKDEKDKDKSPGSPTNASNSLSLSESRDRDFIDDEIADQPGLMFDEQVEEMQESLGTLEVTESNPETLKAPEALVIDTCEARKCSSVSTLSPCESITSDDLMIDFDRSENVSRAESRLGNMADTCALSQQEVLREWSQLLASDHTGSGRLLRSRPTSTPDSPLSLDGRARSTPSSSLTGSPLRPPRQAREDDNYVWLDRTSYQQMCQDIVNMKTMLLKLKRLFQDAETINPFDSSLKNGLFYSLAGAEGAGELGSGGADVTLQEEVVEMRRQAVFLQQQVDERDRTIKLLQLQMNKYTSSAGAVEDADKTNAATQTERMRPVSGPMMLQSLPPDGSSGPLVSLNERATMPRHNNGLFSSIPTMRPKS